MATSLVWPKRTENLPCPFHVQVEPSGINPSKLRSAVCTRIQSGKGEKTCKLCFGNLGAATSTAAVVTVDTATRRGTSATGIVSIGGEGLGVTRIILKMAMATKAAAATQIHPDLSDSPFLNI